MKGTLVDMSIGLNGRQRITIELVGNFREEYERLKDGEVNIEIKKYRKRRSLNANSYFHLLVTKIAEHQGLGIDEVKTNMVIDYGTVARDGEGMKVGIKLPASVNPSIFYPYVRRFDTRIEDGKEFHCYIVLKQTSLMDSAEMARLIDGTIREAQALGIETDTPEQLARYQQEWGQQ